MQIKTYGEYSSDEKTIKHDGTILANVKDLSYEDIQCKLTFDVTIELVSGTEFTGTITVDLPSGNIITEGTSNYEKTDFTDIIFKRN